VAVIRATLARQVVVIPVTPVLQVAAIRVTLAQLVAATHVIHVQRPLVQFPANVMCREWAHAIRATPVQRRHVVRATPVIHAQLRVAHAVLVRRN
jgi:hypothetical protein